MKCPVIRDLLPLYSEGLCSAGSRRVIEEHLKNCSHCMDLYDTMGQSLNIKDPMDMSREEQEKWDSIQREVFRKYYGKLILKGIGLLFAMLLLVTAIWIVIKL